MKGMRIGKRSGTGALINKLRYIPVRPGVKTALMCAVKCLLTYMLCGGQILEGRRFFALAFTAACGADISGFFALVGAVSGYTVKLGFFHGLRYSAAALAVFMVSYVTESNRRIRRDVFTAVVCTLAATASGTLYLVGVPEGRQWLLMISESVLAGGCTYFYILAMRGSDRLQGGLRDMRHCASFMILAVSFMISLSPVELLAQISLGRLMATITVMLAGYVSGTGSGSAVGTICGLAMDAAVGQAPFFTMAYAFAGMISGLFRKFGRLCFVLAYILSNAELAISVGVGEYRITILYEVFVTSVIFMLLPYELMVWSERFVSVNEVRELKVKPREYLKSRVDKLAAAFSELHDIVKQSDRTRSNVNEIATVFDCAAERACRKCVLVGHCWQKDYESTVNALNDCTEKLRSAGRLEKADLPNYFSSRCVKLEELISAVNQEYAAYLRRRQQFYRRRENRDALCSQYSQVAAALRRVSDELCTNIDVDTAAQRRLERFIKTEGVQAQVSVFRDTTGRLRGEIWGEDLEPLIDRCSSEKMSAVLKVPVGRPEKIKTAEGHKIVIVQAEPYAAVAGAAAKTRAGQSVSGDSGSYFKDDDGMLYLLLSDGMGSGEEAQRESVMCMRMLQRFLCAGMEPVSALKTLNDMLVLGENHIVTAVDLLVVDLFTGQSAIYKYGAAPSYIKRGRTVRRMDGRAMVAGSGIDGGEPDVMRISLEKGDFAIIASDGVSDGTDDEWLRQLVAYYNGDSPNELAKLIIERAEQQGGAVDDMTVLCLQLVERKN